MSLLCCSHTATRPCAPQISRVKLEESRRAVAGQDDVVDARHRQHKFKTAQNKVDHMLKRLNEQVRALLHALSLAEAHVADLISIPESAQ